MPDLTDAKSTALYQQAAGFCVSLAAMLFVNYPMGMILLFSSSQKNRNLNNSTVSHFKGSVRTETEREEERVEREREGGRRRGWREKEREGEEERVEREREGGENAAPDFCLSSQNNRPRLEKPNFSA